MGAAVLVSGKGKWGECPRRAGLAEGGGGGGGGGDWFKRKRGLVERGFATMQKGGCGGAGHHKGRGRECTKTRVQRVVESFKALACWVPTKEVVHVKSVAVRKKDNPLARRKGKLEKIVRGLGGNRVVSLRDRRGRVCL